MTGRSLSRLPKLEAVTMGSIGIDINEKEWYKMTQLRKLVTNHYTNITDNILSMMHHMEHLVIYNNITDDGISNLLNLRHLVVGYDTKITDIGIKDLTNLDTLVLITNKVKDTGLHKLNLRVLAVNSNITNSDISHMHNLRELTLLHNKKITSAVFSKFPKLQKLVLNTSTEIVLYTDSDMLSLVNLKYLDIKDTDTITYKSIQYLKNLRVLKVAHIDDKAIYPYVIADMLNLETLILPGYNATFLHTLSECLTIKETKPNTFLLF